MDLDGKALDPVKEEEFVTSLMKIKWQCFRRRDTEWPWETKGSFWGRKFDCYLSQSTKEKVSLQNSFGNDQKLERRVLEYVICNLLGIGLID